MKYILFIIALFIIFFSIEFKVLKDKEKILQTQNSNESVMRFPKKIIRNEIDENIIIKDLEKDQMPITVIPIKTITPIIPKPYITAESYLVGNLETEEIYLSSNSSKIFPIASLSKLFTALVNEHIMDSSKEITIVQEMLDAYGEAGNFVKDEKFTAKELLYPLLLESSNDAAEAMAQSFGYEKFINSMNSFAKEIGMNSTSFKDATGLTSANISNANDLFTLAKYLYKNEKDLLEITKLKEFELATTTEHNFHHFISINPFVFYEPFIGGKTGRTKEAKESMVSLFNFNMASTTYPIVSTIYSVASTTYPIAIIVLRSDFGEREIDTEKIFDRFSQKIVGR